MIDIDFIIRDGVIQKYNEECLVIPYGIVGIGDEAFKDCKAFTRATIPNSVKSIGERAFFNCKSLKSVTIPEGVTNIHHSAFNLCKNLKEIYVSENNPNYTSVDGVLFNKDKTVLIDYPNSKSEMYEIPYGVTSIDESAFLCKTNLKRIIIPDSLQSVGDDSFVGCKNLKKIELSVNKNINSEELERIKLWAKKIYNATKRNFD